MVTATTLTGAEFDALLADDERRLELFGGEIIEMPAATPLHQLIVQKMLFALMLYLQDRPDTGQTFTDIEFALGDDWRFRPDVAVVLGDRATAMNLRQTPTPGAPDIAVEVISPGEHSERSMEKVQAYLRYGTKEAWQVYPEQRLVLVHTATVIGRLSADDRITTPLLPGFALDLKSVF